MVMAVVPSDQSRDGGTHRSFSSLEMDGTGWVIK